jgi:hypothetical protein
MGDVRLALSRAYEVELSSVHVCVSSHGFDKCVELPCGEAVVESAALKKSVQVLCMVLFDIVVCRNSWNSVKTRKGGSSGCMC